MIDAIKKFFEQNIHTASQDDSEQRLRVATAALLIETARADSHVTPEEMAEVANCVRKAFDLSLQQTRELVELAESEMDRATCFFEFTSLINQGFDYDQKIKVVELMWQVVFADQFLEKYEEALVRKIADLLYVAHKDFIAAKLRVQAQQND
ncbi:MAG: TerB family tellurite resistance protein [Gammaproteobacteria bacterium]|nr:TerB family tellurite resistance protein [Gammaproteobacteria bacterium]MDH5799751.1 TerB family tellurite resistance protein [Gammaproteobacteria bacterium]